MCKAGGFYLTKFISNRKKLLLSIPESQRRIGVKDQDLSGQLPNEKALGICWEIGKDACNFKIKFDERPLTRRVILSVISSIYDPLGFAVPFVLERRRMLESLCEQDVQWSHFISDHLIFQKFPWWPSQISLKLCGCDPYPMKWKSWKFELQTIYHSQDIAIQRSNLIPKIGPPRSFFVFGAIFRVQ